TSSKTCSSACSATSRTSAGRKPCAAGWRPPPSAWRAGGCACGGSASCSDAASASTRMSLEGHGSSADDRLALWTVHRTLEKVGVDARLAWVLHHLEQEGIEEVANSLDCSKATAKRRIAEAQRKIKKALDR